MSSPFQLKFMAKNPTKGFTMGDIEKASEKSQKEMVKNAEILNKQNPETDGPNYEKIEEFDHAGADGYEKLPIDTSSPLNGAYESGADSMVYVSNAPAFSKLQNQINASTKEAMYGLAKDKKDEEISDAFKSFSFKPKDLSSKYKTTD